MSHIAVCRFPEAQALSVVTTAPGTDGAVKTEGLASPDRRVGPCCCHDGRLNNDEP